MLVAMSDQMQSDVLEPRAGKPARAVLRGGWHSDVLSLPDYWVERMAEDAAARGHLAALLGWDESWKKAKTSKKAEALTPAGPAASVDKTTPQTPATGNRRGAAPGRSAPRSRGPRKAPRAPATLSTLWHLARAMQGETPTTAQA